MFQLGLQCPDAGHGLVQLASHVSDSVVNPTGCALKMTIDFIVKRVCSVIQQSETCSCNLVGLLDWPQLHPDHLLQHIVSIFKAAGTQSIWSAQISYIYTYSILEQSLTS